MSLSDFRGFFIMAASVGMSLPLAPSQVLGPLMGGPNQQFQQLFERVARSEFVVHGKVLSRLPVWKRGVPKVVSLGNNQYRTANIEDVTGGSAFNIEVLRTFCMQRDFVAGSAPRPAPPERVPVFVPYDRARNSDIFPGLSASPELLIEGKEYLFFLLPYRRQSELKAQMELDADTTWYRVFDGHLGARQLPDLATRESSDDQIASLIAALTAVCKAAEPADIEEKLSRLRTVRANAEPRWNEFVDAAIRTLEAQRPLPGKP